MGSSSGVWAAAQWCEIAGYARQLKWGANYFVRCMVCHTGHSERGAPLNALVVAIVYSAVGLHARKEVPCTPQNGVEQMCHTPIRQCR